MLTLLLAALAADAPFRAGAAVADLTPRFPISMAGNMQDHLAKQAHDPPQAVALALDDGTTRIVLATCDSVALNRAELDAAKRIASARTGIPTNRMLIAATHSHSCPTAAALFQSKPDAEYVRTLPERIAGALTKAVENLRPAELAWGVGKNPADVFNRRFEMKPGTPLPNPFGGNDLLKMNPGVGNQAVAKPAGPVDPEVFALAARSPGGAPFAGLGVYSLHYVGGVGAGEVSADYFGVFRTLLGPKLGGGEGFVGMLFNGASGNVNNVNVLEPQPPRKPYEQMRLVAERTAAAAAAGLQGAKFGAPRLAMAERELELAVRRPTAEEIARAERIVAAKKTPNLRTIEEIYAGETLDLAKFPATEKVLVQTVRIGGLALAALPCEVFVEIGLELKEATPGLKTAVCCLANGYSGYLPTAEQHRLGGYETWRAKSSRLEVDAAAKFAAVLKEMLRELAAP